MLWRDPESSEGGPWWSTKLIIRKWCWILSLEDQFARGILTPIASNIACVENDHKSLLLLILESSKFGKTNLGTWGIIFAWGSNTCHQPLALLQVTLCQHEPPVSLWTSDTWSSNSGRLSRGFCGCAVSRIMTTSKAGHYFQASLIGWRHANLSACLVIRNTVWESSMFLDC